MIADVINKMLISNESFDIFFIFVFFLLKQKEVSVVNFARAKTQN